jgi:hypothetical protein
VQVLDDQGHGPQAGQPLEQAEYLLEEAYPGFALIDLGLVPGGLAQLGYQAGQLGHQAGRVGHQAGQLAG